MWTPKRVLLLGLGIGFFLVGYGVYAFFLGGIDGLAPLPKDYLPGPVIDWVPEAGDDAIDTKLRLAFGQECHQVTKTIKFEVRKKGMVVAASSVNFTEPDGRVKLIDVSLALFKENTEFKFPEITTLQSDKAWLTFDQPIANLTDIGKSKITGTELQGNIVIINNRHTPEKYDDLEVLVQNKPLYYDDRAGKIWTEGIVRLLDKQTRPEHTKINGRGMEMLLAKETQGEKKPAVPKVKSDLSGIDMIMLKSSVTMDLYTESSSGFLSGTGKPNSVAASVKDGKLDTAAVGIKEAPKKTAQEKSHVVITTDGPFVYDVPRDIARFESPSSGPDRIYPDQIKVQRTPISDQPESKRDLYDQKNDQLVCDYLELNFVRETGTGASRDRTERKIESAHATARPGMEVVLVLDTENLECHCDDLKYFCATADRGAKTVLKGEPLKAVKDGHMIRARELVLVQANQKGVGQSIVAKGPGQVDLFDRNQGKGYTTHAIWKAFLTSVKYPVGDKELDLLTLTEDAAFIDDEHQQKLYGQRLLLWLETVDMNNQATPAVQPETGLAIDGPRQRPHKVEAYERVSAQSPQLLVNDCTSLKIRFKDAPRAGMMLPEVMPIPIDLPKLPPAAPAAVNAAALGGNALLAALGPAQAPPSWDTTGPNPPKQAEKPKEPINLVARDVVADVLRNGDKNDLNELVADGNVHVKQNGATPKDKGVDIKGEALNLLHFVEGDILKVYGNSSDPAELQLGELFLVAPKVTINQKTNSAWAEGVGAMNMPSNTTFDGGKPNKPDTRIVVHWTRDMIFEQGRDAEFHGGVVAYQDDSTLQCKTLQVALDRPVSFKEGQKEGEQAKVEKIIAHGDVHVYDEAKDPITSKFISSRHLFCTQLAVNNRDNIFVASGPGEAATLQFGETQAVGPNAGGNAPKQGAALPKQPELQLTRIEFQQRMHSTVFPNTTTRQTTFTGKIKLFHFPADRLEARVDTTKLPKDAMILECEQLKVLQRQLPNNKSTQTTEASKSVSCWTIDIFGRAEVLTFDESTDIVTFKGSPGNPAQVFQKIGGNGSEAREYKAQTILYNRKTGLVSGEGSSGFGGSSSLDPVDRWRRPADDMTLVCQLRLTPSCRPAPVG